MGDLSTDEQSDQRHRRFEEPEDQGNSEAEVAIDLADSPLLGDLLATCRPS
jgi:hypothetical protein